MGSRWMPVLRLAVAVGGLTVVLLQLDLRDLLNTARGANLAYLAAAFATYLLAVGLQAERWRILSLAAGHRNSAVRFQLVNYGAFFFDLFVPGKLGSDAYRILRIAPADEWHRQVGILIVLRLQGLVASATVFVAAGLLLADSAVRAGVFALAALGLSLAVTILLFGLRYGRLPLPSADGRLAAIRRLLVSLGDGLRQISWSNGPLVRSYGLGLVFVAVAAAIYAMAGRAFGMTLEPLLFLYGTAALIAVAFVPITVQGRGITEVFAIVLWGGVLGTTEQILLTCLAVYGIVLLQGLSAGLVVMLRRPGQLPASPS